MSYEDYKKNVLKTAKEYVQAGFYVFPVHSVDDDGLCSCGNPTCGDAGKHPAVARGLKEASRDLSIIEKWFDPDGELRNIGLVTGEISGITVIDIDIGEGKFGAESWAEAIKEHGEPDTLMAETGSGGMHVLFKYNSALKTASNVLGKGVDCRNDGGYIVAPPSRHRSGGQYKWLNWGKELMSLPAHLSRRKETRGRKRKDDIFNSKYTIEQVRSMLEVVPSDDRDLWRNVGVILGRQFNRIDEAWELYNAWADKAGGKKGRNHDEIMREAFYEISQQQNDSELSIGTIVKAAIDNGWVPKAGECLISNFLYYAPSNHFIYRPNVTYWPTPSVDVAVSPVNENGTIIKASDWIKRNQLVTSLTVDPSTEEDYIKDYDCRNGEIIPSVGGALYNTYIKPKIEMGDARLAQPFLNHVHKVFNKPGDADQFLNYMAHRVQKPWEKPRFALLISGEQGVGKDTAVEFCIPAIGSWNVSNIDPAALDSHFNEYASATLIRISETSNLHEMSKWAFNEQTKVLIAGSPDVVSINPKYGQKYSMRMFCGVIMTTNHLSTGIYIPADDRRYDVIDCASKKEMGLHSPAEITQYFQELWEWFNDDGGKMHVACYLNERDISKFCASTGQRKTDAHKMVVQQGYTGDHWLDDIINEIGNPDAFTAKTIVERAVANGMKMQEVQAKMTYALDRGKEYFKVRNLNSKDGRWKINNKYVVVYARPHISVKDAVEICSKEVF